MPRVYGRVGYDVPVAQSATFRLKPYDTASDDDDASVVDEANAYAEGSVLRSQAGAGSAVDDPGGGIDDPGGGDTDDLGSFDNLATSTTTSSKTSVSFVSSSLTTGFSLLSLSDKSAVDVVGGPNKSENQKEKNQLNSQLSTTPTTQHPKGIAARITPHSITPKSTRHTRRDGARRAK